MEKLKLKLKLKLKRIKRMINGALGRNILKQEAMLRLALKEEGLNYKHFTIEIDHVNGYNYVNGVRLPIIYPRSFFTKSDELKKDKKIDFYFNGNMSDSGGRKEMLKPFLTYNSLIEESDFGRLYSNKTVYNHDYFSSLASAKFGLCPHQKDFLGEPDTMWTYRFIESCMCKSIPLVFVETPLGRKFIDGFTVVENIDLDTITDDFSIKIAEENYELCKSRHSFINNSYLARINVTSKRYTS
nr:hypothetical protein [uncultured Vibrio sp.]